MLLNNNCMCMICTEKLYFSQKLDMKTGHADTKRESENSDPLPLYSFFVFTLAVLLDSSCSFFKC
jgi:hypothetical protein